MAAIKLELKNSDSLLIFKKEVQILHDTHGSADFARYFIQTWAFHHKL